MAKSIAFEEGKKAAEACIALENSALTKLNPTSTQYEDFIAGYDSVQKEPDTEN